jgi:OmpA-OmpF porin, OOP family
MKQWGCTVMLLVMLILGIPSLWAGQQTYETNEWVRHADVDGSADMAGISRFQGAIIQYFNVAEWGKYTLPVSKLENEGGAKAWKDKRVLEGKITRIQYSVNRKNNPAFIAHNYETALTGAGWKVLFRGCGDDELGNDSTEWCFYYYGNEGLHNGKWGSAFGPRGHNHCYLAASLDDPLHTHYVAVYTVDFEDSSKGLAFSLITQDVIAVKKAQTGLVAAGKMGEGLSAKGHIALYGLYFDTGKADVKPSSAPALEQVADLLKQQPGLNLYVVGHTDDAGGLDANMALSKARADAVVQRLVRNYNISAGRLRAGGVGPLAPVATNDTDDGRALNRRVELVKTNHATTATGTGRPAARTTRSRAIEVPSFDIKQDAALAGHGQTDQTPNAEPPAAAQTAKPDEPAAPPKLVLVPTVIGKFKINAERILKQQGFKVILRGKRVGRVTSQSPNADARVALGSNVTITIGK